MLILTNGQDLHPMIGLKHSQGMELCCLSKQNPSMPRYMVIELQRIVIQSGQHEQRFSLDLSNVNQADPMVGRKEQE